MLSVFAPIAKLVFHKMDGSLQESLKNRVKPMSMYWGVQNAGKLPDYFEALYKPTPSMTSHDRANIIAMENSSV